MLKPVQFAQGEPERTGDSWKRMEKAERVQS